MVPSVLNPRVVAPPTVMMSAPVIVSPVSFTNHELEVVKSPLFASVPQLNLFSVSSHKSLLVVAVSQSESPPPSYCPEKRYEPEAFVSHTSVPLELTVSCAR